MSWSESSGAHRAAAAAATVTTAGAHAVHHRREAPRGELAELAGENAQLEARRALRAVRTVRSRATGAVTFSTSFERDARRGLTNAERPLPLKTIVLPLAFDLNAGP